MNCPKCHDHVIRDGDVDVCIGCGEIYLDGEKI